MLLKDLRQNIGQLKGLGPKACQNLSRLGIHHICELLQHYPSRYLDHRRPQSLLLAQQALRRGQDAVYVHCLAQVVAQLYIPWRSSFAASRRQGDAHAGQALKLQIEDDSGATAYLLCFGRNFLASQLPVGTVVLVGGRFQFRYGELQCSVFVHEVPTDSARPYKGPQAVESGSYNGSEFGGILPVYRLTQGVAQKLLRGAVAHALQHFSFAIEDQLPQGIRERRALLCKREALRQIHFPDSTESLKEAHRSLVYEELFVLMLLIQRRRLQQHKALQAPTALQPLADSPLLQQALACLPFALSLGQREALDEILASFGQSVPMNRLLQGDVGCGKTIVALLSALPWLEAGAQVVLMAPTELLARQLWQNVAQLRQRLEEQAAGEGLLQAADGLRRRLGEVGFLAASVTGAERRQILQDLRSGELRLLVGTHALFSQAVQFAQLRYIVVDEQHRFGVEQRLALKNKGSWPHVLLMSATPIPRTLALTLYGDLDISSIRSMPAQRKSIKTHLVRQGNDAKVYNLVGRELAAGRQAYFIYPLIEADDETALRSVAQMQGELQRVFGGYRLAAVHGQMASEQRDAAMEAFRRNEAQILLATTVVEVGVDVPNASVMVIDHAERFGLAQLHQLRGRVGRSAIQGYCLLLYKDQPAGEGGLSALAKERLLTVKDCGDGFAIAEKDLELRGPGDLLGAEQSGSMELRIAKIPADLEVLERAKADAVELLKADYALLQPAHQGLRALVGDAGEVGAAGLEA